MTFFIWDITICFSIGAGMDLQTKGKLCQPLCDCKETAVANAHPNARHVWCATWTAVTIKERNEHVPVTENFKLYNQLNAVKLLKYLIEKWTPVEEMSI